MPSKCSYECEEYCYHALSVYRLKKVTQEECKNCTHKKVENNGRAKEVTDRKSYKQT